MNRMWLAVATSGREDKMAKGSLKDRILRLARRRVDEEFLQPFPLSLEDEIIVF